MNWKDQEQPARKFIHDLVDELRGNNRNKKIIRLICIMMSIFSIILMIWSVETGLIALLSINLIYLISFLILHQENCLIARDIRKYSKDYRFESYFELFKNDRLVSKCFNKK